MNWNQLQYVITIAEEKSITKAAQKLSLTQPAASQHVRQLEKELGVTILSAGREISS